MATARIRWLEECTSTSDEAIKLANDGAPHGSFVVSKVQTAGRGRRGRTWSSPLGGLYLSVVVRPLLSLNEQSRVPIAAGVAVAESLRNFDLSARLKWPNDVLVARKKIAGILTEKAPDGALVVGIGVNINDVALPDGSLSMADAMVDPPEPRHLATQIVDKLCRWVSRSENQFSQVVRTWKAYMYQDLPLEIALADRTVTGRQIDLTYDGSVVVADENNNEHVISCGDAQVVSSV